MDCSQRITETSAVKLVKATLLGGLVFLLPFVLVAVLLGHAMHLASAITQPVSDFLTFDRTFGATGERILAIVLLFLIALVAGFAARTRWGKSVGQGFESSFLAGLPAYQMAKSMAEGLARIEGTEGVSPVLVNLGGGWQIGYRVEKLHDDWVAVFVPRAPTPMSGQLMYLPAERVRPVEASMPEAMMVIKNMGIGSAGILSATDLDRSSLGQGEVSRLGVPNV